MIWQWVELTLRTRLIRSTSRWNTRRLVSSCKCKNKQMKFLFDFDHAIGLLTIGVDSAGNSRIDRQRQRTSTARSGSFAISIWFNFTRCRVIAVCRVILNDAQLLRLIWCVTARSCHWRYSLWNFRLLRWIWRRRILRLMTKCRLAWWTAWRYANFFVAWRRWSPTCVVVVVAVDCRIMLLNLK